MRFLGTLAAAVLFVTVAGTVSGTVYVVAPDGSGDYATIIAAVEAAIDGDVIELTDGVFTGIGNRDVDYLGKSITIRSRWGQPENRIVDCESAARGFLFQSGESRAAVLQGITVTRGRSGDYGGAVYIAQFSSPLITHCVFQENWADYAGGAISCLYSCNPAVEDCVFVNNSAAGSTGHGGGMHCGNSSYAQLDRCVFAGNYASWRGGGFHCHNSSSALLRSCTFYGNGSPRGGGIGVRNLASVVVENTIIAFGSEGVAILCDGGEAVLSCSDVFGNVGGDWSDCLEGQGSGSGNLSLDPLFCGAETGDFHLTSNSPCTPENQPDCGLIGAMPVGCDATAIQETTWGQLKAIFR